MQIDGASYTLIGVAPPGFAFPMTTPSSGMSAAQGIDIWVPLPESQIFNERSNSNYWAIGRLSPGISLGQAQSDMAAIGRRLAEQYPKSNGNTGVVVSRILDHVYAGVRPALLVILGAISLVLLIGCANVANLLLARGVLRRREVAIRAAIGASRGRLFAQLLTESVVLAVIGGAAGLAVSKAVIALIVELSPNIVRLDQAALDLRVLLFTGTLSVLTGVLFGALPAWYASRTDLATSMKGSGAHRRSGPLAALVIAEMAVAVVLLAGAGLMMRSFLNLIHVDLGFNPAGVSTGWIMLPPARYQDPPKQARFFEAVVDTLEKTPGIQAASAVTALPMTGINDGAGVWIAGTAHELAVDQRKITGAYFRTLQIPLLAGRAFDRSDRPDSPPVAIISESLARKLWPDENPIDRQLSTGSVRGVRQWKRVIGVVKDVSHYGVDAPPKPTLYLPEVQSPDPFMQIAVRSTVDASGLIVRAAASVDSAQPVFNVDRMDDMVTRSVSKRRFEAVILIAFAALALILASIGIYGVTSFAVNRRSQEIGIRMSLGARPATVLGMILGQGMRWTAIGLAIGLTGAFLVTRLLRSFLFGVTSTDPLTFIGVVVLLAAVSLVANYIPARRALKVDPVAALRTD